MPMTCKLWIEKLSRMNPDWSHVLWGEDLIDRYAEDPYTAWMLAMGEKMAFVVDRLRLLILRDQGGLYCDVDCFAVRPFRLLDALWNDQTVDFVAGLRSPDRRGVSLGAPGIPIVDNTVLGSAKDGRMINRLCNLYTQNSRKHTGLSTGREVLRHADENTRLLGSDYFYAMQDNPKAILLHDGHNIHSWNPNAPSTS